VPGVTVKFTGGRLVEVPTASPDTLIMGELFPDRPFLDPLDPVPLERFRPFYDRAGPSLEITSEQLADLHARSQEDAAVRERVERLVAGAEGLLARPVPQYEPCPFHWIQAPPDRARKTERAAAELGHMRRVCALAFALTGEERFARKAWEAFETNVAHFYTYGVFRMPYSWRSPWDSGYELYDAAAAYDLIAHWEGLTPLDHALVFCYLRRLGLRVAYAVELSPVIGSQQSMWTCNLGCITLYAPEFPEARTWPALVEERMHNVMADFMTDGGQIECDPQAHALALEYIVRYARLAARHNRADIARQKWGAGQVSVETCLDWLAKVVTPLGTLPAINGTSPTHLASCLPFIAGIEIFGRGDWLHAGRVDPGALPLFSRPPDDLASAEPTHRSLLLPDTGFAVLRDGWAKTDSYLLLDYGPHGGPQGHLDKLSFTLYANGQPWVLDAGPSPHASIYAEQDQYWHRQTVAHNTVLVDGRSQRPTSGKLVAWNSEPTLDMVAAEHDGYEDLIHRRTIIHPRGGYFLLFDELVNTADQTRDLRALLHIHGARESGTMGRVVFWREGEQGLVALPAKGRGLRGIETHDGLCLGCDGSSASMPPNPEDPDLSPGDPGWEFIPYIGLKKVLPARGTQTYCVALIPFQGQEPVASLEVVDGQRSYVVELKMGDIHDRILVRRRDAGPGRAGGLGLATTDGGYVFVREENGKTTVMETDGGDMSIDAPSHP